ncbi:MAG: YdiU family protein [Pseudomonadales bacterium]|nr:YdiU family protein [Pseudomonadales bacterium]
MSITFENTYTDLPAHFYSRLKPTPVSSPGLIRCNDALCKTLLIDPGWISSDAGVKFVAGNFIPAGADPIATVYAGHQFGNWNPQLGDGRAILMGEVKDQHGQRYDIQLKGSGPTPYSRGGDGRAPLGPILREYIVSEAMHALAVPTCRSLAAVTTGDSVHREQTLPGAVIARVAKSHIRIGTFQFFAAQEDHVALKALYDHVIKRHYAAAMEQENPTQAMFMMVMQRAATLVAHWQSLGFIHGVMNTDNILLSGETIDYGPCAFIDAFDPNKVFSSIDRNGRYAYSNQPGIMHWNLSNLAQCLLPLLHENQDTALTLAQDMINQFPDLMRQAYLEKLTAKLGIQHIQPDDIKLIEELLNLMTEQASDFTLTFRYLADLVDAKSAAKSVSGVAEEFQLDDAFKPWIARWQQRLAAENVPPEALKIRLLTANPIFIPRNHLIQAAIEAATNQQNFQPFNELVDLLSKPFDFKADFAHYARPPNADQIVQNTFCGT